MKILVIDDAPLVARTLKRLLRDHEVTVANHPSDALGLLTSETFEMVLCDFMMPSRSGRDLYEEIVRTCPEMAGRFVFMTGGSVCPTNDLFLQSQRVLYKPFGRAELDAVIAALSSTPPAL